MSDADARPVDAHSDGEGVGGDAAAPFGTREAFAVLVDRVERLAIVAGAHAERARVSRIMRSPNAANRLALAWELAASGFDEEFVMGALAVASAVDAIPPVDAGETLH